MLSQLYSVSFGLVLKVSGERLRPLSSSAIALRRPTVIPWSSYLDETVEMLFSSPDALLSDRYLVHLIKLDHITEDTAGILKMDDPIKRPALGDMSIQYHIKGCEGMLQSWLNQSQLTGWNVSMG